jgi:hypothetical protein
MWFFLKHFDNFFGILGIDPRKAHDPVDGFSADLPPSGLIELNMHGGQFAVALEMVAELVGVLVHLAAGDDRAPESLEIRPDAHQVDHELDLVLVAVVAQGVLGHLQLLGLLGGQLGVESQGFVVRVVFLLFWVGGLFLDEVLLEQLVLQGLALG